MLIWLLMNKDPLLGHIYKVHLTIDFTFKYYKNFQIWASRRENLSLGFANNKGPDQSAFVIPFLESIISKLAAS